MQQVQEVIDCCTRRENCPKSRRGVGQHVKFAVFSIFPYLSMVLKLLQIDIDKTTGEVSPSVNGPAKGRKNYKLFEGTRIITDNNS
jgi:hypothetical protein